MGIQFDFDFRNTLRDRPNYSKIYLLFIVESIVVIRVEVWNNSASFAFSQVIHSVLPMKFNENIVVNKPLQWKNSPTFLKRRWVKLTGGSWKFHQRWYAYHHVCLLGKRPRKAQTLGFHQGSVSVSQSQVLSRQSSSRNPVDNTMCPVLASYLCLCLLFVCNSINDYN